jgi:hypothetical protein
MKFKIDRPPKKEINYTSGDIVKHGVGMNTIILITEWDPLSEGFGGVILDRNLPIYSPNWGKRFITGPFEGQITLSNDDLS